MGGYTPKTAVNKLGIGQRESQLPLKDASNHVNQDVRSCNRLGCSTRSNSMKNSAACTSDKIKLRKPSFHTSSGTSMTGSWPKKRDFSLQSSEKHHKVPSNSSFPKETISVSTNQAPVRVSDSICSSTRDLAKLSKGDVAKSGVLNNAPGNSRKGIKSTNVISNTKISLRSHKQSTMDNQHKSFGFPKLPASGKVSQAANSGPHGQAERKMSRCTSRFDVLSSGCSSSHLSHSKSGMKKNRSEGECSASGKITSGLLLGRSSSTRGSLTNPRVPLSERTSAQQASKRTKSQTSSSQHDGSVNSQKVSVVNRTKIRSRDIGNKALLPEPLDELPRRSCELLSSPSSSSQLSSTVGRNSYRRLSGNSRTVHDLIGNADGTIDSFSGISVDQDGSHFFNTEGIAEVLSAMERIEQDEELTYEQRLVLETNLFLESISFLDQHRDMRLDIDNMSYEELLDLEEKMGTVSTALTEEDMVTCISRSCYRPPYPNARSKSTVDDDVKCSICQEDYVEGDEMGKLVCGHGYHFKCIYEWLQQKNWCPVCKSSAALSS